MRSFAQHKDKSRITSTIQKLKQIIHPNIIISNKCILSYRPIKNNNISLHDNKIWMVIVLSNHDDIQFKTILNTMKNNGLYDQCYKITLKFTDVINRKIMNLCKLNYDKIVIDTIDDPLLEPSKYIDTICVDDNPLMLYFDLTTPKSLIIDELLIKHTINDWQYCIQLLLDDDDLQSIGMFPISTFQFWFNCFWTKLRESKTKSSISIMKFSQSNHLNTIFDIENTTYEYEKQDTNI